MNVELPRQNRVVPDLVVELVDGTALHLDAQAKNQKGFEWRSLDYYSAIHQTYEPPRIVQVLLYLGDPPLSMHDGIAHLRLQYQFDILELAKVPAEIFLASESDAERILAVLCHSSDVRETIRRILAGWKLLPRKRIEELMERLSALSQLRKYDTIAKEEIERMPIEIDITENAFYKAGEEKGEAKTLLRILETRFGTPGPAAITEKILTAGVEQLDRWVDRALRVESMADIF